MCAGGVTGGVTCNKTTGLSVLHRIQNFGNKAEKLWLYRSKPFVQVGTYSHVPANLKYPVN